MIDEPSDPHSQDFDDSFQEEAMDEGIEEEIKMSEDLLGEGEDQVNFK